MDVPSSILNQFLHLEQSGKLDALDSLRKENRELERIINDAALLIAFTDVNSMLDFMIACMLDHFIPQFMGFLVHPPRGKNLRQFFYRNLKQTNYDLPVSYYEILKNYFTRNPGKTSFKDLLKDIGPDMFGKEFLELEPEMIFPMTGIGGIYGIVILGKKLVGNEYTELEHKYIDRMIRFLSVSIQNGLHYESSITDPKTGLFTHDYFSSRLDEATAHIKRHKNQSGVLMIDIDHFKNFNDTWGHVVGDKILIELSKVLMNSIRAEDCAARFGGEEFAVYVESCNPETLVLVAERIRKAINNIRLPVEDQYLSVTVSIGARLIEPRADITTLSVITEADKALYKSKAEGRNRTTLFLSDEEEKNCDSGRE
ncbi:GGDEF domain-containing protein [Brucepastera parasyntrophica]|uniref:GGDEF domain-containing protein n=1 Tax=Brucepastera parasyntrophica TaxID=2880008 RepID=UPI0021089E5D|nr:GGDEF domain-containing protein [Brucepastera parasyntrophica]ULQ60893.1 GGDEF domain-containing protein [Brucepastera parasyntrophica]